MPSRDAAGSHEVLFRIDDDDRLQIVTAQSVCACQQSVAATERMANDTHIGATARSESGVLIAELLVDVPERNARANRYSLRHGIECDVLQASEIDDYGRTVGISFERMPSTPDRKGQRVLFDPARHAGDACGSLAECAEGGAHRRPQIVDRQQLVVLPITGTEQEEAWNLWKRRQCLNGARSSKDSVQSLLLLSRRKPADPGGHRIGKRTFHSPFPRCAGRNQSCL